MREEGLLAAVSPFLRLKRPLAVLCFLSHKSTGKQLVEPFKDVQVEDLVSQYA